MLERIQIENFALIEQLVFEPRKGLNILTGETGAGKSLIIDAIHAITGKRVSRSVVRTGTKRAMVECVFSDVESLLPSELPEEYGILVDEEGLLYLSREILADGKSYCRVNGRMVPLSIFRQIGENLVDIHGQHDQQAIFSPKLHMPILDRLCDMSFSEELQNYSSLLSSYKECIDEVRRLGTDPEVRNRRVELLQHRIQEIMTAAWEVGEEEKLKTQKKILLSSKKVRDHLEHVMHCLDGDGGSVRMSLSACIASLKDAAIPAPEIQTLADQAENAYYILENVRDEAEHIAEIYSPGELSAEQIDDRLDLFSRLRNKYGVDRDAVMATMEKDEKECKFLLDSQKILEDRNKERLSLEKRLMHSADLLHACRQKTAEELAQRIVVELKELGMKEASFSVQFQKRPKERFFSRNGYDEVEFLFSANKGEPLKPLAKIASGGESSRIMLAIKTILSVADDTPVLIFDEIDTGISGKAAGVVARKLRGIAQSHQVMCITHMAQIAACADTHFYIDKESDKDRTYTILAELDTQQRIHEVARLLAGDISGDSAVTLATEMIHHRETK